MKVTFIPLNKSIEIKPEESLLKAAKINGINIKSLCKGEAICCECRIKIVGGENNILPPTKNEISAIGSGYFIDQRRLACQVRCFGDITVDISEQLQKTETQSKKMKGVKKGTVLESQAIQDTYLLKEKINEGDENQD
jgi:2Fe-2S ferredoxin